MCQRAAAGAGVPFGLAEDCAAASAWLATAGLAGVEAFHRALERFLAGSSGPVEPEVGGGAYSLSPVAHGQSASALFAGPALSDRIPVRAPDGSGAPLCARAVDEPLLVLACIVAAGHAPPALTVRWQGPVGRWAARCRDGAWSILGDDAGGLAETGSVDVFVDRESPIGKEPGLYCLLSATAIAQAVRRSYHQGVAVDDEVYRRVDSHARKMLVADSPRSRIAGAGAGLRDND